MNFGVNLYNWFLTNAQSLVLMAIVDGAARLYDVLHAGLACACMMSAMQ